MIMMFLAMITLMVYPVSAFAAEGPAAPDLQIGLIRRLLSWHLFLYSLCKRGLQCLKPVQSG